MPEKHLVSVRLGQTFEIGEPSNPTTGHTWTANYDPTLLELRQQKFEKSSKATGAGGLQKFTFVAKRKGKGMLRLVYHRPWENSPLRQSDYEIVVE